jgi:hypothetical protein
MNNITKTVPICIDTVIILEENARNDTNGTLCPQEWDTPKKNGTLQ